ncbi:hypothetical protein SmJEL517_g01768 [Synchytrium microbalum]|uniref:HTH APSES-type domain-containing protein n=1 Tax=Synchytrium microbalum TaxID=1806994 RepID=A0A507C9U3_9FUNG|nr:uncharacterized protein SmJEL517_g01768 [Synchytrium microbalum]TPX35939.1 hypothetical protein SmJEL517_g01768 [Synchytrium microbalum]
MDNESIQVRSLNDITPPPSETGTITLSRDKGLFGADRCLFDNTHHTLSFFSFDEDGEDHIPLAADKPDYCDPPPTLPLSYQQSSVLCREKGDAIVNCEMTGNTNNSSNQSGSIPVASSPIQQHDDDDAYMQLSLPVVSDSMGASTGFTASYPVSGATAGTGTQQVAYPYNMYYTHSGQYSGSPISPTSAAQIGAMASSQQQQQHQSTSPTQQLQGQVINQYMYGNQPYYYYSTAYSNYPPGSYMASQPTRGPGRPSTRPTVVSAPQYHPYPRSHPNAPITIQTNATQLQLQHHQLQQQQQQHQQIQQVQMQNQQQLQQHQQQMHHQQHQQQTIGLNHSVINNLAMNMSQQQQVQVPLQPTTVSPATVAPIPASQMLGTPIIVATKTTVSSPSTSASTSASTSPIIKSVSLPIRSLTPVQQIPLERASPPLQAPQQKPKNRGRAPKQPVIKPETQDDGLIRSAVYSSVPVYEFTTRGVSLMKRVKDGFMNATQILKLAGIDKGRRTKILEKEVHPNEHEKVQGGYGKYQGTWVPFSRGIHLAQEYGVEELLRPLLDYKRVEK